MALPATSNWLSPSRISAVSGALVVMRVLMILASWLMTTTPTLHAATGPIERRPMPRSPQRGRYRMPMRAIGTNRISAWNATPAVQAPAVSASLSAVQNSTDCWSAPPNSRMNTVNPMQLITLAPTELHA